MAKTSKQSIKLASQAKMITSQHDSHTGKLRDMTSREIKPKHRNESERPVKKLKTNEVISNGMDIDILAEEKLGALTMEEFLSALTKDYEKEEDEYSEEELQPSGIIKIVQSTRACGDRLDHEAAALDPDFKQDVPPDISLLNLDLDYGYEDYDGINDQTADSSGNAVQTKEDDIEPLRLTAKILSSYEQGAFKDHGIGSLKKIVSAYKSACHLSDAEMSEEDKGRSKDIDFDSPLISNRVIVLCLDKCHLEFSHHLLQHVKSEGKVLDPNTPIHPQTFWEASRWSDMHQIIYSFFKATMHWLSKSKDPSLITFVLKSLTHYVPYLFDFRVASLCLKRFILLWSDSHDVSVDYQSVRLNAFLRIRQMSITQPLPFIGICLKRCFLAYAKRAKFANAATVATLLPTITFMGNCCVELYCLDYTSSFQHAFIYIRQLALRLRNAQQKRTPESFKPVYCWQYMHCLKLWVAVLAATCQASHDKYDDSHLMRSLIYPLVEVILGTARLIPSVRFLPLRFHCVRLLQQLAASTELYIPTTSLLLDVLDLEEIYLKPKSVNSQGKDVRSIRLAVVLKLPKVDTMRTVEQLDSCLGELFTLLNREVDLYRYSAGFPEFTFVITQRLRGFSMDINNGKYRAYSRGCIDSCEKLAQVAVQARCRLTIAPKDVTHLEILKPKDLPSMSQRYHVSVANEDRYEFGSAIQANAPSISHAPIYQGDNRDPKYNNTPMSIQADSKFHHKDTRIIYEIVANGGIIECDDDDDENWHEDDDDDVEDEQWYDDDDDEDWYDDDDDEDNDSN